MINNERPKKISKANGELNWTDYHNYIDIYAWLDALKLEFPEYITIENLGSSYEGRPLKLIKLSKQPVLELSNPVIEVIKSMQFQNTRAVFIEANIHAREWITSATATYIINELLRSTDPEVQEIAQNVDWYIVPITNIDGFAYTWEHNRNWRKTRSPTSLVCYGVDANRNWEYSWLQKDETGNEGASRAPCSDTFAGSHAFSENETLAIHNYLERNPGKFDAYIALHSYAHQMLHPYGHRFASAVS